MCNVLGPWAATSHGPSTFNSWRAFPPPAAVATGVCQVALRICRSPVGTDRRWFYRTLERNVLH